MVEPNRSQTRAFFADPKPLDLSKSSNLAEANRRIAEIVKQGGASVVDPAPLLLLDGGKVRASRGREVYFVDTTHLSYDGAMLVFPALRNAIRAQAGRVADQRRNRGLE